MHTIEEIEAYLRAHSDKRAIAIWQKFGINTKDEFLGVGLTNLKNYAKQLKKNQIMAEALWQLSIHDAKVLACFLFEPKLISKEQIKAYIKDIQSTDLADKFGSEIIAKSSFITEIINEQPWEGEMQKRTLLSAISSYAKLKIKDKNIPLLQSTLDLIASSFNNETNWVRDAMNYTLIAIGKSEPSLKEKALAIAESLWPFTIDYGDTSCITLNPIKYISGR